LSEGRLWRGEVAEGVTGGGVGGSPRGVSVTQRGVTTGSRPSGVIGWGVQRGVTAHHRGLFGGVSSGGGCQRECRRRGVVGRGVARGCRQRGVAWVCRQGGVAGGRFTMHGRCRARVRRVDVSRMERRRTGVEGNAGAQASMGMQTHRRRGECRRESTYRRPCGRASCTPPRRSG
jgi:hypothetical protein